jgi:hypothetical protein
MESVIWISISIIVLVLAVTIIIVKKKTSHNNKTTVKLNAPVNSSTNDTPLFLDQIKNQLVEKDIYSDFVTALLNKSDGTPSDDQAPIGRQLADKMLGDNPGLLSFINSSLGITSDLVDKLKTNVIGTSTNLTTDMIIC